MEEVVKKEVEEDVKQEVEEAMHQYITILLCKDLTDSGIWGGSGENLKEKRAKSRKISSTPPTMLTKFVKSEVRELGQRTQSIRRLR